MKFILFLIPFLIPTLSFAKLEAEAKCLYHLEDIMTHNTPSDFSALNIPSRNGITPGLQHVTMVSEEGLYLFTSALTHCPFKDEDKNKNKQFPKVRRATAAEIERGMGHTALVSQAYIISAADKSSPIEVSIDFPRVFSTGRTERSLLAHPKVNHTSGTSKKGYNELKCQRVKDPSLSSKLEAKVRSDINSQIQSLSTTFNDSEHFYWDTYSLKNIERDCGAVKGVHQKPLQELLSKLYKFYFKHNPEEHPIDRQDESSSSKNTQ